MPTSKIYDDRILRQARQMQPNLKPNVLHNFASYNTIFTLSGLTEEEFSSQSFLTDRVHDVIARTGGIGGTDAARVRTFAGAGQTGDASVAEREALKAKYEASVSILKRAHHMSIENVNITSTTSPNLERGLGNFTKMEFEISEAYGITLIEKIRAATAIAGYQDYMDAPLLLTIEFRGLDETGSPVKIQPVVRKVPIGITRVDFDVNEGGAQYSVLAVPYPELAYDDRYKFPRTDVPVAVSTPEQWADDVMQVLNVTMMDNEIKENKREIADKYDFSIDRKVLENGKKYASNETNATITALTKEYDVFDEVEGGLSSNRAKIETIEGTASSTTSLTKFFEDAIRSLTGYKDLAENFWVGYLRSVGVGQEILDDEFSLAKFVNSSAMQEIVMKNQYVDWFKIKTTVRTNTDRFDRITRMHPKTIEYRAIPYKIHVLKLIRPGISIGAVDWSTQVHKEYNYIYTGDNLDVQNLRINYKTAYYMRNVRGNDKGQAEKGIFNWLADTTKELLGQEKYPEPLKPLRQYPSTNKGRSALNTAQDQPRAQEFYDYLTNPEADMIRIEMDILGDPAYLCQDQYMPVDKGAKREEFKSIYNLNYGSFNADAFQPLLNLKYRLPDEVDVAEGTTFSGNRYRDENLFFNGVYQINKIESKFDQGQFLQTLFCTRLNNQQGLGATPLTAAAEKSTSSIIEDIKELRKLPDSKELLKKQRKKELDDFIGDIKDLSA